MNRLHQIELGFAFVSLIGCVLSFGLGYVAGWFDRSKRDTRSVQAEAPEAQKDASLKYYEASIRNEISGIKSEGIQ